MRIGNIFEKGWHSQTVEHFLVGAPPHERASRRRHVGIVRAHARRQ